MGETFSLSLTLSQSVSLSLISVIKIIISSICVRVCVSARCRVMLNLEQNHTFITKHTVSRFWPSFRVHTSVSIFSPDFPAFQESKARPNFFNFDKPFAQPHFKFQPLLQNRIFVNKNYTYTMLWYVHKISLFSAPDNSKEMN